MPKQLHVEIPDETYFQLDNYHEKTQKKYISNGSVWQSANMQSMKYKYDLYKLLIRLATDRLYDIDAWAETAKRPSSGDI